VYSLKTWLLSMFSAVGMVIGMSLPVAAEDMDISSEIAVEAYEYEYSGGTATCKKLAGHTPVLK